MAGCIPIRRKEITSNSRLQRLSAILNVFSEASENPTAWVFYFSQLKGLFKLNVRDRLKNGFFVSHSGV